MPFTRGDALSRVALFALLVAASHKFKDKQLWKN